MTKQLLIEDWKIIPDTHGKFVVSDRGRIGELLSDGTCGILRDIDEYGDALRYNKDHYCTLWLCNIKRYCHILVAQAFITNPLKLKFVNHKDSNPRNNCVTNLEWIDQLGNQRHRTWLRQTKFNWSTKRWEMKSGRLFIH